MTRIAMTTERIADHDFDLATGRCVKCGRSRTELVAYGHPDIKLEPGENTGLSCSGRTNDSEIQSIRDAWRRDKEKWDRLFA